MVINFTCILFFLKFEGHLKRYFRVYSYLDLYHKISITAISNYFSGHVLLVNSIDNSDHI